jgi:4'-phosphopantetheinyl transferase
MFGEPGPRDVRQGGEVHYRLDRVAMGLSTKIEFCEIWDAELGVEPSDLPPDVVHLWQRRLRASAAAFEACYQLLSVDEREKASRYRVERPRNEFVLTRGTLRFLISRYLRRSTPQGVLFRYTEYGKPFLDGPEDLRFNVSHTEDLALIAFVKKRDIGIDVERIRPQRDVKQVAERFFSARERQDLDRLSGDELHAAFFRCWTRKEAYIKAKGEGLSLPLHEFDVAIGPNQSQALLATRPDPLEADRWILRDVAVFPGYAAAVAVRED